VPWNLKLEENFTSLFNYYSTFFFDADECGLLSKKNRKIQQQIIIMPVILSLNLLKKNTSCCVGFQYSYSFSYWLYIWFFSLLIADRFWKFYRKFTLPPSRVKEKSRLSCVWFSFCGWGCGKVQPIYAQNSTIKANFSCFLWLFLWVPHPTSTSTSNTNTHRLPKICFRGGIDSDELSFFQRCDSC
jgi:hypothetical protein